MLIENCGIGAALAMSAPENWNRGYGDSQPNRSSRPSPAHVRDVLHGLACAVSASERQFEQHCRQVAEETGIPSYRLRRQTIRDGATHSLSAQKLGAIHAVCGVRFGSLAWELMGIDLNALASWHAAAYPDQTIRLPDYLWNPEFTFRCPTVLDPHARPAVNSLVEPLVQEWSNLPLGMVAPAGKALQVYRIGEATLQPLLHPGDLVLVQPNRPAQGERYEEGQRPRPVMEYAEGRFHAGWARPDLNAGQVVGPIVAFCKNLRRGSPPARAVACGPMHRRSDEDASVGQPRNGIARIIREFRVREGVALKALVNRLHHLVPLLPEHLAREIPSISSLSAMEHEITCRPKLSRLLLISIATKTDLRCLLSAAGVSIADEGKVSVAEKLGWRKDHGGGIGPLHAMLRHPLPAALAAKWTALPWLATQLLPNLNPSSVFYIGRRSPFMHPMLAEQSFVAIDRKRTILPQAAARSTLEETAIDGWPPAYMLEIRRTGQLLCANCRREGDTLHLVPYDQFAGQRMTLDLNRDVLVLGEVTGVASCLP